MLDRPGVPSGGQPASDEAELLALEARYCSYGDTVHYTDPPKFFERCEGSFLYDPAGNAYLDLQMWYSAVNFGYANPRLNAASKRQLDTLPQLACQYLHREKIELAARIAGRIEKTQGVKGRVHFNVGGSQAVEDALKLVRNATTAKNLMFAFEGGYHGRTLGASAITSSYRYRRRYGHFGDRAHFVPFPYCFRCPYGKKRDRLRPAIACEQFERLFDTEYHGVWDAKAKEAEFAAFFVEAIQGTGGYVIPPPGYFEALARGARGAQDPAGRRRDPDGLLPRRQVLGARELQRQAGHHRVRQGADQRPQSARPASGRARS